VIELQNVTEQRDRIETSVLEMQKELTH